MDAEALAEEMRALASKHQRQLLELATSQSDALLAAVESYAGGVPDNVEAAKRLEATRRSHVPEELTPDTCPAATAESSLELPALNRLVIPLDGTPTGKKASPQEQLPSLKEQIPSLKPAASALTGGFDTRSATSCARTEADIQSAILATIEDPPSTSTWWMTRHFSNQHVPSMTFSFSRYFKVDSQMLDTVGGILVLLNSLVMLVELEMIGQRSGQLLLDPPEGGPPNPAGSVVGHGAFHLLEILFSVLFIIELGIRIRTEPRSFWSQPLNMFDAMIVITSCVDLYILTPLTSGSGQNGVLLRLLRTLRAMRALRMTRSLKSFRGLRLLVQACNSFFPSLVWSMVLLGIFILMAGLVIGTLLQDYILDEAQDYDDRMWVWAHYGTALRSIYTMYEITFSGSWPQYARPVYAKLGHAFTIFFVLYVTVIVFAITRVISAIFLRDTLEAASNDAEMLVQEKMKKKQAYVMKLKSLFQALDSTGKGIITQDVLNQLLEDPKVIAHFQTLELDVHEGAALFHLLDDGDGEITCEEFIDGILRCHGPARAIDQLAMHSEMRQLGDAVTHIKGALEQVNIISPRAKMRTTFRLRANARTFRHLNRFRIPQMPEDVVQPKKDESSREQIMHWQLAGGAKSPESII